MTSRKTRFLRCQGGISVEGAISAAVLVSCVMCHHKSYSAVVWGFDGSADDCAK